MLHGKENIISSITNDNPKGNFGKKQYITVKIEEKRRLENYLKELCKMCFLYLQPNRMQYAELPYNASSACSLLMSNE